MSRREPREATRELRITTVDVADEEIAVTIAAVAAPLRCSGFARPSVLPGLNPNPVAAVGWSRDQRTQHVEYAPTPGGVRGSKPAAVTADEEDEGATEHRRDVVRHELRLHRRLPTAQPAADGGRSRECGRATKEVHDTRASKVVEAHLTHPAAAPSGTDADAVEDGNDVREEGVGADGGALGHSARNNGRRCGLEREVEQEPLGLVPVLAITNHRQRVDCEGESRSGELWVTFGGIVGDGVGCITQRS